MSQEIIENLTESSEISEMLDSLTQKSLNIPILGEVSMLELPKYLPLYLAATKTKAIRDLVPKDLHKAIMEFAYATGMEEKPLQKTKLEDIPLPRQALVRTVTQMYHDGWGHSQIAKQLNMHTPTVRDMIEEGMDEANERKLWYKFKKGVNKWLERRVEKQLNDVLLLEPVQRLLEKEKQVENQKQTKP